MGLYGARGYLARHGTPTTPPQLKEHYHVGFDESMSHNPAVQRLERCFSPERIIHRSSSFVGQLQATLSGIGLGIHDCVIADAEPALQRLMPEQFNHAMEIWLVTHSDMRSSARIRAVYDFLADALAKDRTALIGKAA
jgi:DNA-binding transcriptional LysR family regulator